MKLKVMVCCLFLILVSSVGLATTYTPNYGLGVPGSGDRDWGSIFSGDMVSIDTVLASFDTVISGDTISIATINVSDTASIDTIIANTATITTVNATLVDSTTLSADVVIAETKISTDTVALHTLSTDSGVLTMGGTDRTHNNSLAWDFEDSSSTVGLSSATASGIVQSIYTKYLDDINLFFGSYSAFAWETTGRDSLQLGLDVGSDDYTGVFSIMQRADMGDANRSPGTPLGMPTLRIYGTDETQAYQYLELFYGATAGATATIRTRQSDIFLDAFEAVSMDTMVATTVSTDTLIVLSGATVDSISAVNADVSGTLQGATVSSDIVLATNVQATTVSVDNAIVGEGITADSISVVNANASGTLQGATVSSDIVIATALQSTTVSGDEITGTTFVSTDTVYAKTLVSTDVVALHTISSDSGVVTIGGTNNTNNEDIVFDFETTGDFVRLSSNTGVSAIRNTLPFRNIDDIAFQFGTGYDGASWWETTGNDNLQIGVKVNNGAYSGYYSFMEKDDMGNANRSPLAITTNPTWRLYGPDATEALDYMESYYDTVQGNIATGSGNLYLNPATGVVSFDTGFIRHCSVDAVLNIPNSVDMDVVNSGDIAYDTNNNWLRVIAGPNQVAIPTDHSIQFSVAKPKDLDNPTSFPIWTNIHSSDVVITGIKARSDLFDTTFTIKEIDSDWETNTTDVATINTTLGNSVFTVSIDSVTLSHDIIEPWHSIILSADATDDPNSIKATMTYYISGDSV